MMNHRGTQEIETARLLLRRFRKSDALAMYENWANDPEVTKFLTWPVHESAAVTERVLQSWLDGYEQDDFYQWAIVVKENGDEPVGSISVVEQHGIIKKAEIGYCIGRSWWHKGIMTEAMGAVMEYLFEQVGFNRIEAKHDVNNPHSGGVMKNCGMTLEGIFRQGGWNNQGICDLCHYAMLASDRRK